MTDAEPPCPLHGRRFCQCPFVLRYAPRRVAFALRIEGTTQALTSEGCTVCDDIPGLTDHGQGD